MSSPPDTTRPTLPPIVTDVEGSRTRSAVTAPPVTTTVPSDPPLVMTVPHIILEVPSEAPSDPVVTVISTVEDVPGKEDIGSAAAIHVSDSVGGDEDELERLVSHRAQRKLTRVMAMGARSRLGARMVPRRPLKLKRARRQRRRPSSTL